jgi:hypothetical protein
MTSTCRLGYIEVCRDFEDENMKISATCLLLLGSCVSFAAFGACENPSIVSVPDGATSTMDQLLDAQADVKAYMAQMEIYLACINEELEAGGEDATAEFKQLMVTRHNTAVTEMETVAASFNEQVQAYRAAHPEEAEQPQ